MALKIKKTNALEWVAEPLFDHTDLIRKKMFGLEAFYLGELLVLVLGDGKEPWNGILLPVERERQAEVCKERAEFKPHPILGKWLYLSQKHADFESIAEWATSRILRRDPRLGTMPAKRKHAASPRAAVKSSPRVPGKKPRRGTR